MPLKNKNALEALLCFCPHGEQLLYVLVSPMGLSSRALRESAGHQRSYLTPVIDKIPLIIIQDLF